jgi:hypothetical protein
MSGPDRLTLVLRFADVGIATYASLRVVGQPSRTVAWVTVRTVPTPLEPHRQAHHRPTGAALALEPAVFASGRYI